jgi:pSer/pThr/pTyr-binding forkhead associated (FHA) protein
VPPEAAPPGPGPQPQPGAPVDPEHVGPEAPRVLAGFLVSFEGNDLGTFWPIYQGSNLVGRKDASDGLNLEIDHPTTSSRHANLLASARPARLKIEDLGSTNGTFYKEEKLAPGTRVEVDDGDQIRFGGYTVLVKLV